MFKDFFPNHRSSTFPHPIHLSSISVCSLPPPLTHLPATHVVIYVVVNKTENETPNRQQFNQEENTPPDNKLFLLMSDVHAIQCGASTPWVCCHGNYRVWWQPMEMMEMMWIQHRKGFTGFIKNAAIKIFCLNTILENIYNEKNIDQGNLIQPVSFSYLNHTQLSKSQSLRWCEKLIPRY